VLCLQAAEYALVIKGDDGLNSRHGGDV
jgi:hypothetical protein